MATPSKTLSNSTPNCSSGSSATVILPPCQHPDDDNTLAITVRSNDGTLSEKRIGTLAEPMETRVVQTTSNPDDNPRILALEAEVGVLRQRVKQRETALAVLNRRLVALERLDHGGAGILEHAIALEDELGRLRQTRMFRWSALLRRVYSKVRRVAGV